MATSNVQKIQYRSLNEAIHDDVSQPDFDPRILEFDSISDSESANSVSSAPSLRPLHLSAVYTDSPSKPLPSYSLHSALLGKQPLANGFEKPYWRDILLHIALCLVSYPILLAVTLVARNKSIFWTRFIVGVGCGLVGLGLGYSLLTLAKSHLEAATWATVIHQSHFDDSPGVRLKDLAATTENSTSAWTALRLLWNRTMHPATAQRSRQDYDQRPWSLFIAFFLLLVLVAGTLPFILGRLINIDSNLIHQRERYEEISIKGDNSDTDIARASQLKPTFEDFALTWTMAPFSTHGGLPPVVSFSWGSDTIYFSETIMSQLLPNGSGFGTFDTETTDPSLNLSPSVNFDNGPEEVFPGSVLRFSKWGIRIRCAKLPDPDVNLVTMSNNGMSYLFTPRAVLASLFSSFDVDYPESSMVPFDITKVVQPGDAISTALNMSDIALGAAFYNNGVGHSFFSRPVSMGADGKGWISIEEVLVRLNTSYTPNGTFARKSNQSIPDAQGNPTWIGYDAAICVELFEPWIVEVYNSTTGLPSTLRIVEPGNVVRSQDTPDIQENLIGLPLSVTYPDVHQQLNSSKLADVYESAHGNSVNQIVKDNGRDAHYVPSPTVVSYTEGEGPLGYMELSAPYFARARGLADASNILPYFSGTGDILARQYQDLVLSSTSINPLLMGIYLGLIFLLGLLAGFFVPRLPLNVPHRGFEVYSWIAAFHADELMEINDMSGIEKNLELHEIEQRVGDVRFRYIDTNMRKESKF
ncbi:hypothetical protein J132_04490 [Termitomyces sp. J132]|nr:hypothetical protein J132_04490 [Termitomyces sp. J132]